MVVSPYLPDIFRSIVQKVDAKISGNVYFDHGNMSQVSRSVYKADGAKFPLVWLVMPFDEDRGKDFSVYADVTCQVIIAMPTDKDYTQTKRDEMIFKPILLPIYDELMVQIDESRELKNPLLHQILHTKTLWSYWGGGHVNSGGDTKNLFDNYIDAISITGLKFKINYSKNCP